MEFAFGWPNSFDDYVTDLVLAEVLTKVIVIDQEVFCGFFRWFFGRHIIIHVVDAEVYNVVVFFLVVTS